MRFLCQWLRSPYSFPEALPVCVWHSGRGCVWTCPGLALSQGSRVTRTADTHTLEEDEKTDRHSAVLTQVTLCCDQVCVSPCTRVCVHTAALCRRKTGTAERCLDHRCCDVIFIIAHICIMRTHNNHYPCPMLCVSDNSESLECYVIPDCSSMEDAEVVLSSCGSASFHS